MTGHAPIVLLVSANRRVRQLIAVRLGQIGCTALIAATYEEAFEYSGLTPLDVLIIDLSRREAFEGTLIRALRVKRRHLKVIYLTGRVTPVVKSRVEGMAADFYLRKPFHLDELCDIVSPGAGARVPLVTFTGLSLN